MSGLSTPLRPRKMPTSSPRASRRVAPLRPRSRGAYGLDAGSAHARSDWLLPDDAKCDPYMLWSTSRSRHEQEPRDGPCEAAGQVPQTADG